jgi:nucleoside-diphosphate kinase
MGPTKVFKSRFNDPETIRGQFGLTDTRNSTHGSDSDETARREMKFFFPCFDPKQFFLKIPENFSDVVFDEARFVHKMFDS